MPHRTAWRTRLRECREAKRLSLTEFARRVNKSRSQVNRWESEGEMPDAATFLTICRVLDCAGSYMLGLKADPARPQYLDAGEKAWLKLYHAMSAEQREAAIEVLQVSGRIVGRAQTKR